MGLVVRVLVPGQKSVTAAGIRHFLGQTEKHCNNKLPKSLDFRLSRNTYSRANTAVIYQVHHSHDLALQNLNHVV